jgi:hypothetical protein
MIFEMVEGTGPLRETWCVAVCRDEEGREFFDIDTLSGDARDVRRKARAEETKLPAWYIANPVVRVARVEIVEVE